MNYNMKKQYKPTSFWNMKPMKPKIKSNTKSNSFQPKFIQPVNLKSYPSRTRNEIRLIDRNPFGDKDGDKVANWFDCRPLNKKKQGKFEKEKIRKGYNIQKKPTNFQKHIIRIIEKDPFLDRKLKGINITTNDEGFAGRYKVDIATGKETFNFNPNRYFKGYAEKERATLKQAILHEQKHRKRAQDIIKLNISPKEKARMFKEKFNEEIGQGTGIYQTNVQEEIIAVKAQNTQTPVDIARKLKSEKPEALKSLPETLNIAQTRDARWRVTKEGKFFLDYPKEERKKVYKILREKGLSSYMANRLASIPQKEMKQIEKEGIKAISHPEHIKKIKEDEERRKIEKRVFPKKSIQQHKEYHARFYAIPENREKKLQGQRKHQSIPEVKEKKNKHQRERYQIPEVREKILQKQKKYAEISEVREKISQRHKKWYAAKKIQELVPGLEFGEEYEQEKKEEKLDLVQDLDEQFPPQDIIESSIENDIQLESEPESISAEPSGDSEENYESSSQKLIDEV